MVARHAGRMSALLDGLALPDRAGIHREICPMGGRSLPTALEIGISHHNAPADDESYWAAKARGIDISTNAALGTDKCSYSPRT